MVFDHRKLMSDSSDVCESFCNATKNLNGFCPPECVSRCFTVCNQTWIIIIPSPDPPTSTTTNHQSQKTHNLHLLLIISLSILSAIFLIFCLYTIFKYYKRWDISRRRRSSSQAQQQETHDDFFDEDHGPMVDHPIWYIRTVGLQPSIINSITVCKYKRGDGLVEGTDCSVCLSEFEEDETLRLLPKCNHAFHMPCIDTWLRSHTNCPMCRAGIVSNTTVLPVPVPVPVPEGSVDDSVVGEEVEVVISDSSGEFRREREDGDCDMRMGMEEEGETRVENGEEGGEISMEEVQPTRRSVSMDSFSASMISAAIACSTCALLRLLVNVFGPSILFWEPLVCLLEVPHRLQDIFLGGQISLCLLEVPHRLGDTFGDGQTPIYRCKGIGLAYQLLWFFLGLISHYEPSFSYKF